MLINCFVDWINDEEALSHFSNAHHCKDLSSLKLTDDKQDLDLRRTYVKTLLNEAKHY